MMTNNLFVGQVFHSLIWKNIIWEYFFHNKTSQNLFCCKINSLKLFFSEEQMQIYIDGQVINSPKNLTLKRFLISMSG